MKITYLGQAGLLIEDAKTRILFDPYLSNYVVSSGIGNPRDFSREFPPPFLPEELKDIRWIFVTHDHADHCDPETILPILMHNPGCKVVGPSVVVKHLHQLGVDTTKLVNASVEGWTQLNNVNCIAIPSAHYELDRDELSGEYPYLGYIIQWDGIVLYHGGDTIRYDGMIETIHQTVARVDICCLPVNGRDTQREALGIIGNLHPEEALDLTAALGAHMLIPLHNDLFKINCIDPQRLEHYAVLHHPEIDVHWMRPAEVFEIKNTPKGVSAI